MIVAKCADDTAESQTATQVNDPALLANPDPL